MLHYLLPLSWILWQDKLERLSLQHIFRLACQFIGEARSLSPELSNVGTVAVLLSDKLKLYPQRIC